MQVQINRRRGKRSCSWVYWKIWEQWFLYLFFLSLSLPFSSPVHNTSFSYYLNADQRDSCKSKRREYRAPTKKAFSHQIHWAERTWINVWISIRLNIGANTLTCAMKMPMNYENAEECNDLEWLLRYKATTPATTNNLKTVRINKLFFLLRNEGIIHLAVGKQLQTVYVVC